VCKDKKERIDLDVSNLIPSSNADTIDNIVFENGSPHDTWQPSDDDNEKTLEIDLPVVNGVSPRDYQIMEIKVKPTGNLGPVTVRIFDEKWTPVFEVSNLKSYTTRNSSYFLPQNCTLEPFTVKMYYEDWTYVFEGSYLINTSLQTTNIIIG
jgi:hypothetical protein